MTTYLIANGVATGDGIDIFQNNMPSDPDFVVALSEYAGLPQSLGVDCSVRSVQVKVRHESASVCHEVAWRIYNLFYNVDCPIIQLNESRQVLCRPRQTPFKLQVDERTRPVWCFNMGVTTYNEL